MNDLITLEFERRPSALAYMVRGALPARRRAGATPGIAARWSAHRVDERDLQAFLRITGLPAGPALPLLYPHTFGFRLAMAVLTSPAFPVPIWGVLQTRNHLLQHRPIPLGARLDLDTRTAGSRVLDRGLELDLHTRLDADGELAWESVVTFFARGRFGAPGPASPLAQAPTVTAPAVASWTMRDEAHWRFGRLTGDYNGIHCWDWYARRFGFPRALYHPPRLLGECLARLPAPAADGPQRLDVWLKGPVLHGAAVRLHAATDRDGTTFALHEDDARPRVVARLARAAPGSRLVEPPREAAPSTRSQEVDA